MRKKIHHLLGLLVISVLLIHCSSDSKKERDIESVNTQIIQQENNEEKVTRIRKIFYSLPSPLELTLLFKKEGVGYNPEKLHETKKRKQYSLTIKKALNLGIYGADLSYAGLFGRHQAAIEYFAASQILAEELGIGRTFQQHFISRLEQNASNRDTLLQVVSDFFLENDSYLKDHNQQDISTYVLTGGWIEGMFLGIQMADENSNAKGVKEIIMNQKSSLHNMILLLQNLSGSKDSEELVKEIGELEVYYNQIGEGKSATKVEAVEEGDILIISDDGENVEMTDAAFQKIKSKVAEIRNRFIE